MINPIEYRPRFVAKKFHDFKVGPTILSIIIGIILALLILWIGSLAVPAVFFLLLILPFLLKDRFRLYLWIVITWPVLTLYARYQLSESLPDITHERVMVPLAFGIALIDGVVWKKKLPQVGFFVVIYVLAQGVSRLAVLITGGVGTSEIIYFLNIVIIPVIMYWITKTMITSFWHLKQLIYALLWVSLLVCFTGIYERAIGGTQNPFPVGAYDVLGTSRWLDVPGGRASGVAANPAIYGGISGLGVLASLCCFLHAHRKLPKFLFGIAILILLYGVFISFTRAAWIAVAFVLVLAQFGMSNLWKKTLPFIMFGLVLLAIGAGQLANDPVVRRRILNPATLNARFDMAQVALEKFEEKPVFGWGPGAYNLFIFKHVQGHIRAFGASSSHNTYFTMLVDGGVLIFLSFSALIILFQYRALQVIRMTDYRSFERDAVWVMLGFIVIFLLLGLSNDLHDFVYFNMLLWISFGAIESIKRLCEGNVGNNLVKRQSI